MNNKSTKCLHALQRSGAEKIFEAYKWVQDHRHEFNKEVYGEGEDPLGGRGGGLRRLRSGKRRGLVGIVIKVVSCS